MDVRRYCPDPPYAPLAPDAPEAPEAPDAERTVSVTGTLKAVGRLGAALDEEDDEELVTPELTVIVPL